MSKPLSEQVADLEATNDALWRDISDIRHDRDRLKDDYDKLKAENVALRDSRKRWHDRFLEAIRERNALDADNHDLLAGQGRVISADQVRPEQIIAYWQEGVRPNPSGSVAHVRAVELEGEGGYRVTDAEGRFDVLGDEDDDYTIVLLEDAPTSNDDYDPAPRLTVHALNTAPVGSTLTGPGLHRMTRTKLEDGRWWAHPGMSIAYGDTSEYMVSQRPNATLTHPERGDHE